MQRYHQNDLENQGSFLEAIASQRSIKAAGKAEDK